MHIADGFLPAEVCAGGYAAAAALTGVALRQVGQRDDPRADIPKASLLAAGFFVASWVHIPLPPASAHLILNGLLGVLLGYYAVPAILVGLFFQAVMFGHGGITTLGINAVVMGLPALLAHHLFHLRPSAARHSRAWDGALGFVAGASGPALAVLLFWGILITTLPARIDPAAEQAAIAALVFAHIPLMILEGIFTAMVVLFLRRVRPELLGQTSSSHAAPLPTASEEAVAQGQPGDAV